MKNLKIRTACGIMILALSIAGVTGCSPSKLDGTQTVVTIEDEKASLGVASLALRHGQSQSEYFYKQFSGMTGSSEIWDTVAEGEKKSVGEKTKDDTLEILEKMYLVRQHAKEYKVELSEEEQTKIKEAAKAFIDGNDAEVLKRIGVTQKDAEEYLELKAFYEKAFDPMVADKKIEVTDEEAKQSTVTYSFLSIQDGMDEEAKAEIKSKMETLLAEYKEQADIASFDMTAHTDAKNEKDSDSFMTTTTSFGEADEEDTSSVDAAVRTAAKDLKDGQLYDGVVEGEAGYFVVRMDKVFDPEATNTKKESIKDTRRQEEFDKIVDGWLKDADVTVEKGVWKKVKLTDKESYSMPTPEPTEEGAVTEDSTNVTITSEPEAPAEDATGEGATQAPEEDAAADEAADVPAEGATEAPAETQATE